MENASPTKCKVVATDEKQHLAISFYSNTHGLFYKYIKGSKTWPLSKMQKHRLYTFENLKLRIEKERHHIPCGWRCKYF